MDNRQIILDTETTGVEPNKGDRIVEIGCVEIVNRQRTGVTFHLYLNPERDMPEEAFKVHGLSSDFLKDKPKFNEVVQDLIEFIANSEVIAHNARFDMNFLDAELKRLGLAPLTTQITVIDSLEIARKLRPGQRNSLDALCRAYGIDNSGRTVHGALLDAELLTDVYLLMTGGQFDLNFEEQVTNAAVETIQTVVSAQQYTDLPIQYADAQELAAHALFIRDVLKQ